ncbi:butyrate kinase [Scandinavium sp. V105_16]|uniref:Probable butyrate kinase n=1 Tax=Scandinavium lactucae TaxID=3095028 RepID=A0AAJ2S035_9ENTR|nr:MULTISPECIES: butyrate kinase [unclassified Scandinavium]MDX6019051.1 butyrate kinase [Scandinavium sp. V105_16]MDX6029987.1 butyrate kinase [Scandinavium sp. V105_12]
MNILAINPGGMSTKVAVFHNDKAIFSQTINHPTQELAAYSCIAEQKEYRKKAIMNALKAQGLQLSNIDEFVGRGGMVRNLEGGIYRINEAYLHDAAIGLNGQHASNLGGILAHELAQESQAGKIAYTVDPVMVDEYEDIARLSGMADISRVRSFHALNHKAVAGRYAREKGKPLSELNLIVAHLGSGISVGAHKMGRIVDVNSALGGDGPMSPERAGGVPPLALIDMCFSGQYSRQEVYTKLIGEGGVYSYLGTKDMLEVEHRVEGGDTKATLVMESMAYQVAKEIGACAVVLNGDVDAVILTGSIARSHLLTGWISQRIRFISSEIVLYPGEEEMDALVVGVLDGLSGRRPILNY